MGSRSTTATVDASPTPADGPGTPIEPMPATSPDHLFLLGDNYLSSASHWIADADVSWRGRARCSWFDVDPDWWFESMAIAKQYCLNECEVRDQCLEAALAEESGLDIFDRWGIRGGLKPSERLSESIAQGDTSQVSRHQAS